MLPIAGQMARLNGLCFFVDTHWWPGGCCRLKNRFLFKKKFFFQIFYFFFQYFFLHWQRRVLQLVSNINILCLSVCLFVFNKRKNDLTYQAQHF